MLRILTDTAADITLAEAESLGVTIVPLSITFPDGPCPQETEEDYAIFYQRLQSCTDLPKTSQPSPEVYLDHYEAAQAAGDDVLVLALSGGLSGTVRAAQTVQKMCGYDRIFVVDTHQAISAQRILVEHAVKLRDQGVPTEEIAKAVEALRDYVTVSGVVDTLTYLRKGGRIPASLAILGNALRIKPVIALQDTILVPIGKVMGRKAGFRMLFDRFEKHPADPAFPITIGFSSDRAIAEEFLKELSEKYDLSGFQIRTLPVCGIIGTHVGENCVSLCYVATEPVTAK